MNTPEPLGYLASLLVLATFCTRDMRALRLHAIASNCAFIGYGALAGIGPVLLPINLLQLSQPAVAAAPRPRRPLDPRLATGAHASAAHMHRRRRHRRGY